MPDNFVGPAKSYLNYHWNFNKYVDDLKEAKEKLRKRKADTEQQLQDENRYGKKPKQEVESWLKEADEKIKGAGVVEEKVSETNYLSRRSLAKLADEMTQEIKEVYDHGHFSNGLVVDDPSAANLELPTVELVGSTTPAEEIYGYLMGNEIGMIGVWGMGGIGKTTTVNHVCSKVMKETKFSKLILTTISQNFDIRNLQDNIASQIKESLSDRENTSVRARSLTAMLRKQGRYLLVLDDAWNPFSLDDVGIPEPKADDGCKVMLTTRFERVVQSMCCKQVQMRRLSEDQALQLFLSKVDRDMLSNLKIESTMKLIVKECSGLPLAIVTVAGSMKGFSDPSRWENSLRELQGQLGSIEDPEEKLLWCLKHSYVHLQQKLQPCFLYCALYPEDYEIPKSDIIEHWVEEGLINQMGTRKAMHDCGHVFLKQLEENCLLERVQNGDCIKMHDLVRDMALLITKENPRFFVKAGLQLIGLSDQQQLTEDLEKISFMRNGIKKIPSYLLSSKCLKLTSLFLSNNSLEEISDSIFDQTPNLKILDLSRNNRIVSLPSSLSNLVNLTALLLSSCGSLATVPSLAKLVALGKLDLEGTSITEVPEGLEDLANLRYLNLGHTPGLRHIPEGTFLKLVQLQHLVSYPASLRQEEVRELEKLEVFVGNTDIHGLRMYVSNKKLPNEYFIIVDQLDYLGRFLIYIYIAHLFSGRFYSQVDNTKGIAFVDVDANFENLISVPSDIQQLVLHKCRKVRSADDIGGLKDATNLKGCKVMNCDDLEYLFSSWCAPLKTLESIFINKLRNLKNLVENSGLPPHGNFSSLKAISLYFSHGIKKLFSAASIWGDHCNLEDLNITHCVGMEEIIASEEEEEEGEFNTDNSIKVMLPKLRRLRLRNLPNLKSICSRNVTVICDSLQEIRIAECPNLERIPLYFSSLENTQPSIPPSLERFTMGSEDKEWWERVEWGVHPNVKNVFGHVIKFTD